MEAIEKGEIFIISDIEEQIVQLADAVHICQEGFYRDFESKALNRGMLNSLSEDSDINHFFYIHWLKILYSYQKFFILHIYRQLNAVGY